MQSRNIRLVAEVLIELFVYDVRSRVLGFRSAYDSARPVTWRRRMETRDKVLEHEIQEAVDQGCCFYVKHVRCLQRSIVSARIMRRRGLSPHVRIGYRTDPFFGHAWVEVDGDVVGDSRAYRRKLNVLDTI